MDIGLLAAFLVTFAGLGIVGLREDSRQGSSKKTAQEFRLKERLRSGMPADRMSLEERLKRDPALQQRLRIASFGLLAVSVGSVWAWLLLIFRFFTGRHLTRLGTPLPLAWTGREILRLILGVASAAQAAMLAEWFLFRRLHLAQPDSILFSLANTLLVDGLVILAVSFLLARRMKMADSFPWSRLWAGMRQGLFGYLVSLPVFLALILVVFWAARVFQVEPTPQPIFTMYLTESRGLVIGGMLFLATVVGPVAEELFFRGILYGWLRVRIGIGAGLFLSAVLFALLHGNLTAFLPILGLGLLFGWLYERTGMLAVPITVHVIHNGGMFYMASLVKSLAAVS